MNHQGTGQCPAEKPRLARSLRKMGRTLTCPLSRFLMDRSDEHKRIGEQAYKLYEELGFPYDEVRYIVNKYMYRTDI